MRIIAGQCGGAQLYAPRGMDTRPTQDKVKESLFSIIQALSLIHISEPTRP